MKLEEVPSGAQVFVDANIFIYHFTHLSSECRAFLARCESGEVQAFTGAHILLEVQYGILTNDSVSVAIMQKLRLTHLVSHDSDLRNLAGLVA